MVIEGSGGDEDKGDEVDAGGNGSEDGGSGDAKLHDNGVTVGHVTRICFPNVTSLPEKQALSMKMIGNSKIWYANILALT